MSNSSPPGYKGCTIFRNQPNHSYFDKPFDEEDCLFQLLNEIDPHFLKPEQKAENINLFNNAITDPRTQKPITQFCYDYTKEQQIRIFHSFKKSSMSEKQHELGVRVLNSLQRCLEVEEEDMYNWYRMLKTRQKEAEYFQKFVLDFNQNVKEQMYAPCRKLLELYQKWYKSKSLRLMNRYPDEPYNTHLGLPQVRLCKNVLSDLEVGIINQEIVSRVGEQCSWQDNTKDEIKNFNYCIGSYADIYENAEDLKDSLEDNLQLQFLKIAKEEMDESPYFYIPLESLLFLLTAGDYVDIPREMMVIIKETVNIGSDVKKFIIMDIPLPSRHCGWHAYEQIVEQATKSLLSLKHIKSHEQGNSELTVASDNITDYKVSTLDDFMKKSIFTADKLCKFSKSLTKWQLATVENDDNFQIFTSIDDFTQNKSVVLKLEYKPKFGCEVLTKYEILKEWFKLKLIASSKSNCLRLDVTNFQTLVDEPLNTHKLEECLSSVYHISCNQLLNNLFEFLKILYNMPSDRYMLRYNPKFKEKLMLCKPSQEITQNTVNLHQLLNTDVTDIEFMSQQNFLPIDENLCNLMHMQHKILPAAFSPHVIGKKVFCNNKAFVRKTKGGAQSSNMGNQRQAKNRRNNQSFVPRTKEGTQSTSTRSQRQRRNARGSEEYKKPTSNKTRSKRIRRIRRKYEAMKSKNDDSDSKDFEDEMELDRKMLNL